MGTLDPRKLIELKINNIKIFQTTVASWFTFCSFVASYQLRINRCLENAVKMNDDKNILMHV